MRLTKTCGPRPTEPLLLWPLAEFADTVWDWTPGFPQPVRAVTRAGWADVGPSPQWLEPGQRVVNENLVEGLAVC
jgi:hypothetical protein